MTTTFRKVIEFNNVGHNYIGRNPNERSHLTLALSKLLKRIEKKLNDFQQDLEEERELIKAEKCQKDKDGFFVEKTYGEGQNLMVVKKFKPEDEKEVKKLIKKKEEEFLDKTIEVDSHFVPIPPKIDFRYIEPFMGFVFKEISEEELDAIYLAQAEEDKK